MYSKDHYYYYQPEKNINGEIQLPAGLSSFMAFGSVEDCKRWLEANDYNPADFTIKEYKDGDIEEVTILDASGAAIPRIEDYTDDELFDGMMDSILEMNHDLESFEDKRGDGETEQDYEDRLYSTAHAIVMNEVERAEDSGCYNFQSYADYGEVEWYDGVREDLIREVMKEMTKRD